MKIKLLSQKNTVLGIVISVLSACGTCPCPVSNPTASPPPDASLTASPKIAGTPLETTAAEPAFPQSNEAPWWNIPYPSKFEVSLLQNKMEFITVRGNQFVDESGTVRIFQGVNIADPDKLSREGHWDRHLFEVIADWGADIVRVPVHPAAWRGLGSDAYFTLLDQAVIWATELNLYLVIDWHSIGNLATGLFQHPMYNTTRQETYEFWRAVSFRYQGIPAVAFYELFNEPTVFNGNLGETTWDEWKKVNEELISIIFSHDRQVIPLVGGFNWAYDLTPVKKAPVEREGIGYVSHPYPQKTGAPYEKNWDQAFGFVAKKYPLFTTEIGYMQPDAPGAHIPVKDDGSYGKRMTDYLNEKGASWTAWCFHPHWAPQLISDWDFTPTESGEHFRSVMKARKNP